MEELRCKTTAADLCNWLVGYLKAKGYPTYAIKTADTWQVGPSAWAEGVTWIGPSRRADVHVRITTLEPELIEVAGEEAIDPRDEAELESVLDAIRARWAAPAPSEPVEATSKLPSRNANLRRWKATWRKIKPQVSAGKSNLQIKMWLQNHDADLQCDVDTIIKIIAEGEKGRLD